MRLARLLADPWTIGAGGFVGALAGVGLSLGPPVGVAVALGAYAVGTAVKALTSREPREHRATATVLPPRGTSARTLYDRARAAVDELGEIARGQDAGAVQAQAAGVHGEARDALEGIGRIAAQTVVLRSALARIDVPQVQRDLAMLEGAGSGAEHDRSLSAVRTQLAVAERLERAAREADGRLLSAALGLESLVASMAEVVAMSSSSPHADAGTRIAELAEGLAGLRVGLAEAEATSRRALSA